LLLLGLSTATAQYAGRTFTVVPYAAVQRFAWEEYANQQRLLQELGSCYSFGAASRLWLVPREVFFTELELAYAFGKVDYDGSRTDEDGEYAPYSASTAYSAFEGTLLLGSTLRPARRFLVTPVAGFGIQYWYRNLDYQGPYAYTEKYLVPSLGGGIRFTYVLETDIQVFSTAYVSFPLSIDESFTLALQGHEPIKVVLHPASHPRYEAGIGVELYRVFLVFSFESWVLGRSDTSHYFYQPESRRHKYGVRVGYSLGF